MLQITYLDTTLAVIFFLLLLSAFIALLRAVIDDEREPGECCWGLALMYMVGVYCVYRKENDELLQFFKYDWQKARTYE